MLRLCLLLGALMAGFVSAKEAEVELQENLYSVTFGLEKAAIFMGKKNAVVNPNGAGNAMYPGGSAGVFLGAIFAHAAVSSSIESARESKEQEHANKVLEPFSSNIQLVNQDFLKKIMLDNKKSLSGDAANFYFQQDLQAAAAKWLVTLRPVFVVTQDMKTITVFNSIDFKDNSEKKSKKSSKKKNDKAGSDTIVIVVSDPVSVEPAKDYWLGNNGDKFFKTIESIYLDSVRLAFAKRLGMLETKTVAQTSIKYLESGEKRIERGVIYQQDCRRTVFEALGGEVKSVPNIDQSKCN